MLRIAGILAGLYILVLVTIYLRQRSMLYFPSHENASTRLIPWVEGNVTIGFCRPVSNARTIWLMMHGNAGQASDRHYALTCLEDQDAFYVLEYPGYGFRKGSPQLDSMNQAASEAYQLLRLRYPNTPICVLGESIGSGPACALAREKIPPDKIVLVVPFDTLANVASKRFFFLPVRLMLHDNWDNVAALRNFHGALDIFGAIHDEIIPIEHAKALAKQIPHAQFFEIPGGHNDWAGAVRIRR